MATTKADLQTAVLALRVKIRKGIGRAPRPTDSQPDHAAGNDQGTAQGAFNSISADVDALSTLIDGLL